MKKKPSTLLRSQAEARLSERKKKKTAHPLKESDNLRLVHQLQVDQIELEMQNEELARLRAEAEALLSQYKDLYDSSPMGYFTLARDGAIRQVNLAGANLLGIERGNLNNRRFGVYISTQSLTTFNTFLENVFGNQQKGICEVALQKNETDPQQWVHIEGIAVHDKKNTPVCNATVTDITERKRNEEQIQKNLREKEILLRELYHRTKNNMQVICSMLRIQASRLEDERTKELFKEIETKIHSMALVHQKLICSKDLSSLDMKDYFDSLISHLRQSYFEFNEEISFQTKMENINILMDTAVPLGLVFNGLISNIIKHAFPDNAGGEITVHLYQGPEKEIVLEVSDNGIGFPKGFDIQKDANFGLETVIDLVEQQLEGTIDFKTQNGLHCKIVIKDEYYKPRV